MFNFFAKVTPIDLNVNQIAEICAMQILVIAATEMEIAPFLKEPSSADILITGVGAPDALFHLLKRVQQIDYDLVIQVGICGSFSPENNLGTCVLIKQDVFADVGIYENGHFYSVFDMGFAMPDNFPYKNGWLINEHSIIDKIDLKKVKGITVNTVSDSIAQAKMITQKYRPDVESMEGAVLHYVCLQQDIPFIQLRSISNFVGERDKSKWKMKEAIDNLNAELKKIINQLTA